MLYSQSLRRLGGYLDQAAVPLPTSCNLHLSRIRLVETPRKGMHDPCNVVLETDQGSLNVAEWCAGVEYDLVPGDLKTVTLKLMPDEIKIEV